MGPKDVNVNGGPELISTRKGVSRVYNGVGGGVVIGEVLTGELVLFVEFN